MTIAAPVHPRFHSLRALTTTTVLTLLALLAGIGAEAADATTLITERAARIADLEDKLKAAVHEVDYATKKLAEITAEREQVYGQIEKQAAALADAQAALVAERRTTATVAQQGQNEKLIQLKNREEIHALLDQSLILTTTLELTLKMIVDARKTAIEAAKPKPGN